MLTIVPTPIGNLKDITLRAIEALKSCDAIICEDTRRTGLLLQHLQIHKPLLVLNDFNEYKNISSIIKRLQNGENLCLVSDAGTPLVSDPGFKLVRECLKENLNLDSLPGPSSITTALTLSGLPTDKFTFVGYPPDKPGHRKTFYLKIKESSELLKTTIILFIAPFKLNKTLSEMKDEFGDINITLAKELTKLHQEVKSQEISMWLEEFKKKTPKGEWVALFNLTANVDDGFLKDVNTH